MRTKLGRVAALVMLGTAVWTAGVVDTAVQAQEPPPSTAPPVSTVPPPATIAESVPPLVAVPPVDVTVGRGTQLQVTETEPPPPSPPTTAPLDALPPNSGEGRRVVYSKSLQRVWTVEADGTVSKTHLVSGRLTWNQPTPGTYSVFSRSSYTCNIKNPAICWRYMVRFTRGPEGDNIGFHEIPKKNGVPVQSISQLGQPLSGGCVRQATPDAIYIWDWAPVGTKVVVLG